MRSSEIVPLRFAGVDRKRQAVEVRFGRAARLGVEAIAKTGERVIDISHDPGLLEVLRDELHRTLGTGRREYIFADDDGDPLDQERMHKRVFARTLRRARIRHRGSYCIRDTFISQALAAGESINWVAKFCETSATMIEKHYWKWVEGRRGDCFASRRPLQE